MATINWGKPPEDYRNPQQVCGGMRRIIAQQIKVGNPETIRKAKDHGFIIND